MTCVSDNTAWPLQLSACYATYVGALHVPQPVYCPRSAGHTPCSAHCKLVLDGGGIALPTSSFVLDLRWHRPRSANSNMVKDSINTFAAFSSLLWICPDAYTKYTCESDDGSDGAVVSGS